MFVNEWGERIIYVMSKLVVFLSSMGSGERFW